MNPLFFNQNNYRVWLSGAETFQTNASGGEEKSAQGKHRLDQAFAQYGESIVTSAIVIEGYSNVDDASNQLVLSRSRAIVVGQHLQNCFQINSGNLGSISLMSLPPSPNGVLQRLKGFANKRNLY